MAPVAFLPIVSTAASYLDWALEQPAGSNRGQVVEAALKKVGLGPGYPWCAAFVHLCGWGACWNPATGTSLWPLPATGGCAELGAFAAKHGVLYETPRVGDVFLIWHAELGRFGHTGIVVAVHADGPYDTIEGNAARSGTREGVGVFHLPRTVRPKDRFIRWTELL
jgi:hypothetical protein